MCRKYVLYGRMLICLGGGMLLGHALDSFWWCLALGLLLVSLGLGLLKCK